MSFLVHLRLRVFPYEHNWCDSLPEQANGECNLTGSRKFVMDDLGIRGQTLVKCIAMLCGNQQVSRLYLIDDYVLS